MTGVALNRCPQISRLHPCFVSPPSSAAGPPSGSAEPPAPPESASSPRHWRLSLDRLGLPQTTGGIVLGLVALYSSSDHITVFSSTIQLQQQWGLVFILASVVTVALDAELASRSRLRAPNETARERDRAAVDGVGRRPWRENAKQRALSALTRQHCFPNESSSTPPLTNRARFQFSLTLLAQASLGVCTEP